MFFFLLLFGTKLFLALAKRSTEIFTKKKETLFRLYIRCTRVLKLVTSCFGKNGNFKHLVGDEQPSFDVELLSCDAFVERLKSIFANVSNFALTNGDFSVCSLSEFSCSELTDRPLRAKINLTQIIFKASTECVCVCV